MRDLKAARNTMSTVHRTNTTNARNSHVAVSRRKVSSGTQTAVTRADIDPPKLDFNTVNKELGLSEGQRNRVRPMLSADERRLSQVAHMHWSSPAMRRSTLWHTRDESVKDIQRTLDPTQVEKLQPMLGPTK